MSGARDPASGSPSRPTLRGALGEVLAVAEFPKLLVSMPWLATRPRGHGEPVLLIPGYGADGSSLAILGRYLAFLGYRPHDWGLGRNGGNVYTLLPKVIDRVDQVAARESLFLIGWSLGGYIARETAREVPDRVRHVITLGTPVVGGPKYTLVAEKYERLGYDLDAIEADVAARDQTPLRVPVTALYSHRDGIVSPEACIDRVNANIEHVHIATRHFGFGFSPAVFARIAEVLAATGKAEMRNGPGAR